MLACISVDKAPYPFSPRPRLISIPAEFQDWRTGRIGGIGLAKTQLDCKVEKIIEVRGSPERGYFILAYVWSRMQAGLRHCLCVGAGAFVYF